MTSAPDHETVNAPPSLDGVLRPKSIAVIGASRTPSTIGYEIVHNLVTHGFQGGVHPVNPHAAAIHSIPAHPSVLAIPGAVDLAIIAVPKEKVVAAAEECGEKGVAGIVVITAGFREVGGGGRDREMRLLDVVRRHGMRMIGPNCLGVLNTEPDVRMNATFAPAMPPAGRVSFMSQSGAMGVTILDYAAELGIGIRHFVSVGNKADVSGNDLLEFWGEDDGTGVILMYLENFGNPRRFTQIARRVTRIKPVIAVKAGRSVSGARAATSHTGALAGRDSTIDALLAQCGVMRVDTVEELFDAAMAFSQLPRPADDTVAVVTNAGGPGIIIADTCEAAGLHVAELSTETQARLRRGLPEEASVRNPVDMIATATPASYRMVLETVLADPAVSSAIAAFVPPLGVKQLDVADAIVEAHANHPAKPLLAVLMGREGLPQGRAELSAAGVPAYIFPESAARALAALNRYRARLARRDGVVCTFDVDREGAAAILEHGVSGANGQLSAPDALALLAAYGIPTVGSRLATSAEQAASAAREIGFPVVLKVVSPDIVHKTDAGGVALDLRTDAEVRMTFAGIVDRAIAFAPGATIQGVLVEKHVRGGRETIIGMSQDAVFGPLLMFGLGGIYVEALADVVFRLQPVTDADAREMVASIRGHALLEGVRGEPPSDTDLIIETIERVAQLAADHPSIEELDVNPFVVFEKGGCAVDARVKVGQGVGAFTQF